MTEQALNDQDPQQEQADAQNHDPLEELRREKDALQDRLLRTAAEFDNYRKRMDRERRELADYMKADILAEICCRSSTTSSARCRRPRPRPTRFARASS